MSYAIVTIFDTLQGEGARAGTRAVFVRFAGCNMWSGEPAGRAAGKGACALWCDTDFRASKATKCTKEQIADRMDALWPKGALGDRWCVLTGGEPALQLDAALLEELHRRGWYVAVETNGSIDNEALIDVDWLTCSPKPPMEGGDPLLRFRAQVDELKVVVPGRVGEELYWTDQRLKRVEALTAPTYVYVQPQDPIDFVSIERTYQHGNLGTPEAVASYHRNVRQCIALIHADANRRLSYQMHKAIRLP